MASLSFGRILLQVNNNLQQRDNDEVHTVAFYSRQTRNAEPRHGQYQLELLVIVQSLIHFRWILDGASQLSIYTDHAPLVTGKIFDVTQPHHNSHRIVRWIERIQHVRAQLLHHKASSADAKMVDALSRRPDYVQATKKDNYVWMENIKHEVLSTPVEQDDTLLTLLVEAAKPVP